MSHNYSEKIIIKIYHLIGIARLLNNIENQGSHLILCFLEKHHEIEDLTTPSPAE